MTPRRFDLAATAIAAIVVAFAGVLVWRSNAPSKPAVREVTVAWRCANASGACSVASEIERCTTCHDDATHPHRDALVARHAEIGCVACHGGDGIATTRARAHEGLASSVEARCATCHDDTRVAPKSAARENASAIEPVDLAPKLTAGRAAFETLRCGACHAASVASPIATPLDVLGLRATEAELAIALADHRARSGYALDLDEKSRADVAAHLAATAQPDAEAAMLHRASVPGATADEGRTLEAKLACAACHATKNDLAAIATTRTPDWVAFYLANPTRANAAATMPSLRLTAREAASLAQHLVTTRPRVEAIDARAAQAGAEVVATKRCATCHAARLEPNGPSLARFGDSHDVTTTNATLAHHANYTFDDATRDALATFILAQRDVRVRADLRVRRDEGATLYETLSCAGCHSLDDVAARAPGPSLFGEGLRVRPQWLFSYLRTPERHPVRPRFHPEWAFRDLVPAERVAVRMPTYALDESQTTSLVRFFSERDGAAFPFAASVNASLAGDALVSALADFTHKDRGACTSCHTIATPDVARAQRDLDTLAPPLALAHERLRPAWIEACIMQGPVWVAGMPAFGTPEQAARLRDLVLLLRERTVLPSAGAEGSTPALGLGDLP